MKTKYLYLFAIAILFFGCLLQNQREGYLFVINNTNSIITFSIDNTAEQELSVGDTSDIFAISINKSKDYARISAIGEWLNNFIVNTPILEGDTVIYNINSQISGGFLRIKNNTPGSIGYELNNQTREYLNRSTDRLYTFPLDSMEILTLPLRIGPSDYIDLFSTTIIVTGGDTLDYNVEPEYGWGFAKVVNMTDTEIWTEMWGPKTTGMAVGYFLGAGDTGPQHQYLVKYSGSSVSQYISSDWVSINTSYILRPEEYKIFNIEPNKANISLINLSVDSMDCTIENNDTRYFVGNDSIDNKYFVDGDVVVSSAGRYKFLESENMVWLPGSTYRYELVPDACEIQLNNLHPNRAIYYVYISLSTAAIWGDDQLGDDILYPQEGYVWKADGDVIWDIRVEAGDPHDDSTLYVYEFRDTEDCTSDITWIYDFPTIFTLVADSAFASSKITGPVNNTMKANSLNKVFDTNLKPARVEKIRKVDAGKAGLKALKK